MAPRGSAADPGAQRLVVNRHAVQFAAATTTGDATRCLPVRQRHR
jgi:hypothetical protein